MVLRVLCIIAVAGCPGPAYQISMPDQYEVGEDATVALEIRKITRERADVVITRPDGTTIQKQTSLDDQTTRVKFGNPLIDKPSEPTFTKTGAYKIELKSGAHTLAQHQITISVDRLTKILSDDEVAGFAPSVRYTRPRQDGTAKWMTYGALYERVEGRETEINVLIEDAGEHIERAWKPYEDEGTLGVIENSNVRFRERTGSVTASWSSGQRVIMVRARQQRDLERAFVRFFLVKYPSALKAH